MFLLMGIQIHGIMQLSSMQLSGRILPRKDAFWFCHLAFYANKLDMQLSGMRLSGLTCITKNNLQLLKLLTTSGAAATAVVTNTI